MIPVTWGSMSDVDGRCVQLGWAVWSRSGGSAKGCKATSGESAIRDVSRAVVDAGMPIAKRAEMRPATNCSIGDVGQVGPQGGASAQEEDGPSPVTCAAGANKSNVILQHTHCFKLASEAQALAAP